ncbi:MAG: tripartite tricarboxylate transporter TctB family protein [Aminivibrio sp.]|jgi:putative tricarboxylic transport membrane protein
MSDLSSSLPEAPEAAPAVKDLSVFVPEAHRRPGELGAAALGFLLGALGYYFALDMTSGEYSSPSVFPKFASALIMACTGVILLRGLKKDKQKDGPGLAAFLLPMDVVVVLILLVAYCVALPWLRFVPSSFLFMVIGMVYLQRGKNIVRAVLISAASLAVLVAIFRFLFMVILP